jgi:zinc transport system ATP-binding protein
MGTMKTESAEPLLRCRDLVIGYGGKPLLPPVSLTVEQGAFWAVLGRNGAGKSSFFKTLLGLLSPVSGHLEQPSGPVRIAYLAQRLAFDELYPLQARDVVASGTVRGWSFLRPGNDRKVVDDAMAAVGVSDLAASAFRSLSGGQKQRVLFARMLATGARVVLLDEPTVGMDAVAEREVMDLLNDLKDRYGLTIIVVTHYLDVAEKHAEHVLFLDRDDQKVVVGSAAEVFAHAAFANRYGSVLPGGA